MTSKDSEIGRSSKSSSTTRPGSVLSSSARTRSQACFSRGQLLALQEKNLDYAHEMFVECVSLDPSNLNYVEALIKNLLHKCPSSAKSSYPAPSFGDARLLKKALAQRDWLRALRLGLVLLKSNPWHITTLRCMAEACAGLHFNEVELVYLKQALDANPKDVDVNRHCARSLARMAQFDQAIACWHRVEQLAPKDREAPHMIVRLSEEKIQHAAELRDLASKQPPVKNMSETIAIPTIAEERLVATAYESEQESAETSALDIDNSASQAGPHRWRVSRIQLGWLEYLLLGTCLLLFFQLFPAAWVGLGKMFDFRRWSWFARGIVGSVLVFFIVLRSYSSDWNEALTGQIGRWVSLSLIVFASQVAYAQLFPESWTEISPYQWSETTWLCALTFSFAVIFVCAVRSRWRLT